MYAVRVSSLCAGMLTVTIVATWEAKMRRRILFCSLPFSGHYEKPNILKYHPQANDILASAGYDLKMFIWNLASQSVAISLEPLPELVCQRSFITCYLARRERERERERGMEEMSLSCTSSCKVVV